MSKYKIDTVLKLTDNGIRIPKDLQPAKKRLFDFCNKSRGGYLRMTLAPPYKKRTTGEKSQNHHINGHCQQISNVTGQSFFDVKKYAKQKAIDRGYPILYNEEGKPVLDLWGNEQGISETETDTIQAGYLIESLHEVAALLEIILDER